MLRAQLIIGFLGLAFFAQVAAHGHLSIPVTRDYNQRVDIQNAPVTFPLYSDFVCRNYSETPSNLWTTLVAGSTTPIQWAMAAAHPGDCFAYISYDGDSVPDTQKKWFKIAEFSQCNLQNTQTLSLAIPSYLPSCDHCVLRWEWYALHLQSIGIVEFYSQCSDVKIVGNPNGALPSPQVTIPGHLPMDAVQYRGGFGSDTTMTGPPVATVGGASYSCTSTYGSSCVTPTPSVNPCQISTQRCLTSTTFQACGIGATTTEWKAAQSCQTGLVCAPTTDGTMHIMCTYPSSVPPVVSTPPVVTVPPVAPVTTAAAKPVTTAAATTAAAVVIAAPVAPVTTAVAQPATTAAARPVTTAAAVVAAPVAPVTTAAAATVLPPSTSTCALGDQKCTSVGSSTYQTCSLSRDGTYWAAAQSCQAKLSCHPSSTANNIYCY